MSRAVLLVGSPKPEGKSVSQAFGEALTSRLAALGWQSSTERVLPAFEDAERMDGLLAAIADADLVVLSFPMYIDTLPAPVTRLLHQWADRTPGAGKRLVVMTQCGFPEAGQLATVIDICRCFASEAGVAWAGHLGFGAGPTVEGRPLERSGLAGRLKYLDVAADALARGDAIPDTAVEGLARPIVAQWVYPLIGPLMGVAARMQGCKEPLKLRRYAQ